MKVAQKSPALRQTLTPTRSAFGMLDSTASAEILRTFQLLLAGDD
jgi:hypothetical protein